MSNIENVDKYYDQLQEAIRLYNRKVKYDGEYGSELVTCDESVKDSIKAVIDGGNEHLLTTLFFYYLVIQSDTLLLDDDIDDEKEISFVDALKIRLTKLNDYHRKIETIAEYVDILCDEDSSYDFNDIPMTDYEKQIFLTYMKSRRQFQHNYVGTFIFMKSIMLILLSYVFDKQLDPSRYITLAQPYIDNWSKKLDETSVQVQINQKDISYCGPFYDGDQDQVIDYIIGQIDNQRREIK